MLFGTVHCESFAGHLLVLTLLLAASKTAEKRQKYIEYETSVAVLLTFDMCSQRDAKSDLW